MKWWLSDKGQDRGSPDKQGNVLQMQELWRQAVLQPMCFDKVGGNERKRFKRLVTAVDAHTTGEPARIVIGGIPHIPGKTMFEKRAWAQQHLDDLRALLTCEPRGHHFMAGTIFTAPTSPEADLGMLIIEIDGFLPMCGDGTIAACMVLVETGMIEAKEPVTPIVLDTALGIVREEVRVENGEVQDVTFRNIPAFLLKRDEVVEVEGLGKVRLDIA